MANRRPKTEVPHIPEAVVKWLEELHGDATPELGMPNDEVWFRAGASHVVRYVRAQYERQQRGS